MTMTWPMAMYYPRRIHVHAQWHDCGGGGATSFYAPISLFEGEELLCLLFISATDYESDTDEDRQRDGHTLGGERKKGEGERGESERRNYPPHLSHPHVLITAEINESRLALSPRVDSIANKTN